MNPRASRTLLLALGGAAVVASAAATLAGAANPANGTISNASPSVRWDGDVTGSYAGRIPVVLSGDDSVPCFAPTCDTFKLTLADAGDLTVTGTAPGGTSTGGEEAPAQVTIRVRKPDGSVVLFTGDATEAKPLTGKIKGAAKGDYDVEYWNNFIDGPTEYVGSAFIGAAPQPAAPTGPAPAPTAAPGPAPKQDLTVNGKAGKSSAKAKKVVVTVTVSRAVKSVTATLRKGSKKVGSGKLGAFSGSKKLTIKAPKLKTGSYSVVLTADDGAGVKASKTIKVKVKK